MKFKIRIKTWQEHDYDIEAKSEREAVERARAMNCTDVLNCDDHSVEILNL